MRALFIAALLAGAATVGCDDTKATPAGQGVIDWDRSKATRASVKSAKKTGESKVFKMRVERTADHGHASFDLDFEVSDLELTEDGKTAKHTVPTKVTAKIVKNEKWEVTGKCSDGPHYKMPSASKKPDGGTELVSPEAMVLDCTIKLTGGGNKLLVLMQIYGDGTVSTAGDDIKVTKR